MLPLALAGAASSLLGGGGGGGLFGGGSSDAPVSQTINVGFGPRYLGTGSGASGTNATSADNNVNTKPPAPSSLVWWIVGGVALLGVVVFALMRPRARKQ
jgi:hypothetical protein